MPRLGLFHATRAAIAPVETALDKLWPEVQHDSLLDEGLAHDIARAGGYTEIIGKRFITLASYLAHSGIDGLLFTCTAFGPAMDECAKRFDMPVLKPNEALLDAALDGGDNIGLVGTHPQGLAMVTEQLEALAAERGRTITALPVLVKGAWDDLHAGRTAEHDAKVVAAAGSLGSCDCILLAQFSMAPLQAAVQAMVTPPVLSSPHAAVARMRKLVERP